MNSLEYSKYILTSISFDVKLFDKELMKSLQGLDDHDRQELRAWCIKKYGRIYPEIIVKNFVQIPG